MSPTPLDRFREAQDRPVNGFRTALHELRAGQKVSHWIWYVFPQLAGLGNSPMARRFALVDAAEATAYAQDPVLGARLLQISQVAAAHLKAGVDITTLMGSDIDALKLVSSMTLFETIAGRLQAAQGAELHRALAAAATEILEQAAAQGYPRCDHTRRAT